MIRTAWRLLEPLMTRPRRLMIVIALLSAAVGLSEALVLVLVVRVALDLAGESGQTAVRVPAVDLTLSSGNILWAAALLAISGIALHGALAWFSAQISTDVLSCSRARAIDAFLRATWERQAIDKEGSLQETTSGLAVQASNLTLTLTTGLSALLSLIALLGVAAIVDPIAMVIVLVCGVVLFSALRPMTHWTRKLSSSYVSSNTDFAEEMTRVTSLAMELRVFGAEAATRESLRTLNREASQRLISTRFASRFGATLYRDMAVLFLVMAVAVLYLIGDVELGGIGAVVILIVRALSSAQTVHGSLQTLGELTPHLESLVERVVSLEEQAADYGAETLTDIGIIDLRGVYYEYSAGTPALRDIDLRIEPGEVLGIVGPSGGGKSTLVQVLLRLRPPKRGAVLIDGESYERFSGADWSRLVSLVPQDSRLVEASVADNIAFQRPEIGRSDIERAAAAAHVDSDIRGLTDGFDAQLSARGGGLSGGQKQRVSIARALVGRPRLLVLDEPTSALDVHSEQLLQSTIQDLKGTMTMVIVAHRMTTLSACDRILVLRDGAIDAIGTPAELLENSDFYRSVTEAMREAAPASPPRTLQHPV